MEKRPNAPPEQLPPRHFSKILAAKTTKLDEQIQKLQDELSEEKDARREERFVGIVFIIILFDIVFFIQMPSFGGPLAILILELLVLIPLARRMGMEEIAQIVDRVLGRMANRIQDE